MDSFHNPSTPTAVMPTNASAARVHRRDTRQPISAANPATIHQGTSVSRFFNGSSAYFTVTLVMAVVTPPNVRVIHDNASFTGASMLTVHDDGKSCWRKIWRPMKIATATSASATAV